MSRVVVIDGYNVIGASDRYSELMDRDADVARSRLVADVAYAQGGGDEETIVVFDGAMNPGSDGTPHDVGGVSVVFSAYGRDADEVIEQLVARRRGRGDTVTVVTSDGETQWVALGLGAVRMSANEYIEGLKSVREGDERMNRAQSRRVPMESRLDAATRAALARWARGFRE